MVLLKKDRAIVIDYKSDSAEHIKDKEEFESVLQERYQGQLKLYRYSINKLYNIDPKKIELRIVYFKDYDGVFKAYDALI